MPAKFTEGSVARQLLSLSGPALLGLFSMMLLSTADAVFIGRLGTEYLAALTLTFPVVGTVGSMALGLGIGASSVISRGLGRQQGPQVKIQIAASLLLSLAMGTVVALAGAFSVEPLFGLLGADPQTLPLIAGYMRVWYCGLPLLLFTSVATSVLRAVGHSKTPSLILIATAAVNLILDPLLIFGSFSVPALQLEGAAYAAVISRIFGFYLTLRFLLKKELLGIFSRRELYPAMKDVLAIGIPNSLNSLLGPFTKAIVTGFIAGYGQEAVAAFGIATRIESFAVIAFMALSSSLGPFVGQNWGARKYHRVLRATKLSSYFLLFWGGLITVVLSTLGAKLTGFFNSDPLVVVIASAYLLIVPVSYAFEGMMFVVASTTNAIGQPRWACTLSVTRSLLLYVPLSYWAQSFWGVHGIFIAAALSNIAAGCIAYLCHLRNNRRLFEGAVLAAA